MESQVSSKVVDAVHVIATKIGTTTDSKSIGHIIADVFASLSTYSGKNSN